MGQGDGTKHSYGVPELFADQPGHPWDDDFLAILLYRYNLKPILPRQSFRRKHAHHQIVFKSAMGKMTGGSVGSFHVFCEKGCLLLKKLKSAFSKGTPQIL